MVGASTLPRPAPERVVPSAQSTAVVITAPLVALVITSPDQHAMRIVFIVALAGLAAATLVAGRAWRQVLLAGPRCDRADHWVAVGRLTTVAVLGLLALAQVVPHDTSWGHGARTGLLATATCLPLLACDWVRARRRLPPPGDAAGLTLAEAAHPARVLCVDEPRRIPAGGPTCAPLLVQRGLAVRLADPADPAAADGDAARAWRTARQLPVVDGAWPVDAVDLGALGGAAAVMVGGMVVGLAVDPRARLSPAWRPIHRDASPCHQVPPRPPWRARHRSRR